MNYILSFGKTVFSGFIRTFANNISFIKWFNIDYLYAFFFRWLHVLSGIMWIWLLWYFNFVQIPNMPNIPDDQTSNFKSNSSKSLYSGFVGPLKNPTNWINTWAYQRIFT